MEIYRIEKGNAPAWLYKAYDYVRMDAFVFGQNIPVNVEFGHDEPVDELEAVVLVEDNKPIAGCRITFPRDTIGKIGRVCVIRERQRSGIGHILIKEAEKWISERGYRHIVINSQDRAAAFYEKCGYKLVPGVDPEIYENHFHQSSSDENKNKHKLDLGFSCVLVEKHLDKEGGEYGEII
ncbi:MAG: GNAT family N-acetyltransferase [Lachnospira sp.]